MKTEEIEREIDNLPHKENRRRRGIGISKKMATCIFAVLIAATLIASGALLTYYGKIETTVVAEQSIQIKAGGNDDWHNWDSPVTGFVIPEVAPGGESFCFKFWVWNRASVEAPILFDTTPDYSSEGITAKVYAFPEEIVLELDNKDGDWNCVSDTMVATLTFDPVSPTFDYDLTVTGLATTTNYAIIYYSDQDPRFNLWGGDGGTVISTFMTDGSGDCTLVGQSANLGRNMPDGTDWNIHPSPDYCGNHNGYDNYAHGEGGAKIWIVPTSDLTDQNSLPLTAWNPSTYLFETDLISYSDCNLQVVPWTMSLWGTEVTTGVGIPSGAEVPFFVCYAFDIAVHPGTYILTTQVVPQ